MGANGTCHGCGADLSRCDCGETISIPNSEYAQLICMGVIWHGCDQYLRDQPHVVDNINEGTARHLREVAKAIDHLTTSGVEK